MNTTLAVGYNIASALRRDGSTVGLPNGGIIGENIICIATTDYQTRMLRKDGCLLFGSAIIRSNVAAIYPGRSDVNSIFVDGTVSNLQGLPLEFTSTLTNIVAVADGSTQARLWLRADGTVAAYGGSVQTNLPASLTNVTAIAAGWGHGLALLKDGAVRAWGNNSYGQTNVPSAATNIVAIAAGDYHNVALRSDGTVISWGAQMSTPIGLTNVAAIFAQGNISAAIEGNNPPTLLSQPPDATVWTGRSACFFVQAIGSWPLQIQWQFNGETIPGTTNFFYRIDTVTPEHAGYYNAIVSNPHGTAATREACLSPHPFINILEQPVSRTNTFGADVIISTKVQSPEAVNYQWHFNNVAVPGADKSFLVITNVSSAQAGIYHCFIYNSQASTTSSSTSLTVQLPLTLTNPAAWLGHTVTMTALASGTAPKTFQWLKDGALIDGATGLSLTLTNVTPEHTGGYHVIGTSASGSCTSAVSRVNVSALATWGYNASMLPPTLPEVTMVTGGYYHQLALRSDGVPIAWGSNDGGQTNVPNGLTNVVALAAGSRHSLALLSNGQVVAWGDNVYGQQNVPNDLTNTVAIDAGTFTSFALNYTGRVRAWGSTNYGIHAVPEDLDQVIAISSLADHCLALRSDGTVVGWGRNEGGQATVPAWLSDVVAVQAGLTFSMALRADGTVVAWGSNQFGQTNVPSGLSNVVEIAAGFYHGVALRADGSVVSWGYNQYGQTNIPASLSNVVAIAASGYQTIAVVEDGFFAPALSLIDSSQTDGLFSFNISTKRGWNYRVEHREDLSSSSFRLVRPIPGDNGIKTLNLQSEGSNRFYRVRQVR